MSSEIQSDLRADVAQLFVVRASGHALDNQRNYPAWELTNKELQTLLGQGVGGVLLLGGTSTELFHRCRTLRQWAANPLLLCADVEEGMGQRFHGGTWLVPPMALARLHTSDPEEAKILAERYGRCTGYQARSCGLNWILAPVCDVNTNPDNPVINVRAWGQDPETVSALASAFHQGLSLEGVLSCAKHFPGHGATGVDSHLDLPILDQNIHELEDCELIPFRSAIAAGVSSVMTGHLLFPNIDPDNPTTTSRELITNLLRQKLGFEGLIVTDALVMKAITQIYGSGEAAVMAFDAGVDLILMPKEPGIAIEALTEALLSGQVPMQRLDEALERRRNALATLETSSSPQNERFFINRSFELERSEDQALSEDLVRSTLEIHQLKPIQPAQKGLNFLRIDGVFPCTILSNSAPAISLPEKVGYRTVISHPMGVNPWQDDTSSPLALDRLGDGPLILQLFIRGNPFRGKRDCQEPWQAVLQQLQREQRLAGLVVYGSPYIWEQLLKVLDSSIPAVYSPGQMPEAQKQALSSLLEPVQDPESSQHVMINEFTN